MTVTEIQSNAFNETLVKMLRELRDAVESIPPDGVKYLPVELVDSAREITRNTFTYDDSAWFNGVEAYKMNSMLRQLRSSKYEYKTILQTFDMIGDIGDEKVITADGTIHIPAGWDGRDGFFVAQGSLLELITSTITHSVGGFRAHITQNSRDVRLQVYIPDTNGLTWSFKDKIVVFGILWRVKGV